MPSRPMFTMPVRSEKMPPRPAIKMGTDQARAMVHVPLEVLPQPPPLLTLVAKKLGQGEPADGFGHGPTSVSQDSGEVVRQIPPEEYLRFAALNVVMDSLARREESGAGDDPGTLH